MYYSLLIIFIVILLSTVILGMNYWYSRRLKNMKDEIKSNEYETYTKDELAKDYLVSTFQKYKVKVKKIESIEGRTKETQVIRADFIDYKKTVHRLTYNYFSCSTNEAM